MFSGTMPRGRPHVGLPLEVWTHCTEQATAFLSADWRSSPLRAVDVRAGAEENFGGFHHCL
jgi:hypothetical protein